MEYASTCMFVRWTLVSLGILQKFVPSTFVIYPPTNVPYGVLYMQHIEEAPAHHDERL